jgi:hypothetical protein
MLNGLFFGSYGAHSAKEAVDAMYRDAGYDGTDDDRLCEIDYVVDSGYGCDSQKNVVHVFTYTLLH